MKIQSVSSFRNYQTQVVNFEKKHKDNDSQPQSSSSLLKAVPVAVLIAMSPMTKTNAQNFIPENAVDIATECVTCPNHSHRIDPKTLNGDSCTIVYYDTDGDRKTAEGLYLVFDKRDSEPILVTINGRKVGAYRCGVKEYWSPKKLSKQINYVDDKFTSNTYFLEGSYINTATSIKDKNGNTLDIEPEVIKRGNKFRVISEELYKKLIEIYGDEIEQETTENKSYVNIYEDLYLK